MPVKDKFDAACKGVDFYGSEQAAWKDAHDEAMTSPGR